MTSDERRQREQKCAHFATSLLRLHKINKNFNIAFFYTCFFAFINAFGAIATTASSGLISGLAQIFISIFVTGMAFWAWTKSFIPKYILAIFFFFRFIDPSPDMGTVNPLFSIVGLVLTIKTIVDLREYKILEKLDGFPHFNERFELHESEYDPTHDTVTKVNGGRMDILGSKQPITTQQTITMIDKKMPKIILDKLPQIEDMYFPKKPVVDEQMLPIITELVFTLESVKKQAELNTSRLTYTIENIAERNKLNTDTSKLFSRLDTQDFVTPIESEISKLRERSMASKQTNITEKPATAKLPDPSENPMVAMLSKKAEPPKENKEDAVEVFKSKYSDYFSQYETIYDDKNKTL